MKKLSLLVSVIALVLGLSACGGSGGGGGSSSHTVTTTNGNFKDADVIGLEYKSGSHSGITGLNGSYTCENGKDITFFVGNVTLGTVRCNQLITPVELVTSGSADNQTVVNLVRFLAMIDDDGDSSNGMTITKEVRDLAKNWATVDFGANFDASVSDIVNDVNNNIGQGHTLPNMTNAKNHLKSTLMCAYSGAFKGSYSGDDHGSIGALISPTTGYMFTIGYSEQAGDFSGWGSQGFGFDNERAIHGQVTTGATFNGKINTVNSISGNWNNTYTSQRGTFSGSRVGGVVNAEYRIVGFYEGSAYGLFSFDIANNNHITGIAYDPDDDVTYSLSGTLNGSRMNVTANIGGDTVTITANFDKTTGTVSNGRWSTSSGSDSGSFSASGCKLN